MDVLVGFIYATSIGFYKSPSRLILGVAFLGLFFILGQTRYTNNGYPKGKPMTDTEVEIVARKDDAW
jgi:hypothetical protein